MYLLDVCGFTSLFGFGRNCSSFAASWVCQQYFCNSEAFHCTAAAGSQVWALIRIAGLFSGIKRLLNLAGEEALASHERMNLTGNGVLIDSRVGRLTDNSRSDSWMVGPFWLFPPELVQIQGVCCWPPQVKSSLDGLDHGCYWLSIQLEPQKPSKCHIHLEWVCRWSDGPFVSAWLRKCPAQVMDYVTRVSITLLIERTSVASSGAPIFKRKLFFAHFWWVDSVYLLIYLGVSKNRGGSPKWMVKIMENPIKMGWFGGTPIFGNIHLLSDNSWLLAGPARRLWQPI